MKTYIIQLEAHDDLVSARDKLAWAKTRRVIFIWPKKGKLLSEYYPLSMLKRDAERLGVDISFISKDGQVRENARELGINVFDSVSQAERRLWKTGSLKKIERTPPIGYDELVTQRDSIHPPLRTNRGLPAGKVLIFIAGLLAVFALVGYFYPSAEIKIFPRRVEQTIDLAVLVNPAATEVNLAGILPGKLTKLELSGTGTGVSSGTIKVGTAKARGSLTVTNNSDSKIAIPRGTRFSTISSDEKTYVSTADVTIDAKGGNPGIVPVEAEDAGVEWNLAEGAGFSVQVSWAEAVSITNAADISGGVSADSPTPSEADYSTLHTQLLSDLKNQAIQAITGQLPEGDALIPSSLDNSEVVSETRSISPGTPSDRFSLEIKVLFTVTTYSKADLEYLANSIMNANLEPGIKAVSGMLELTDLSKAVRQDSGAYSWNVHAIRQTETLISTDALVQSLVGVPVTEVQGILNSQGSFRAPGEVLLRPRWWIRMPFVSFRIAIEEQ